MEEGKIQILNSTTYVEYADGEAIMHTVESRPPHNPPKGKIWHGVLERFVPESWKEKKMWVDASKVFDEGADAKADSEGVNPEVPVWDPEKDLKEAIEGLSDDAALALIEKYKKIPRGVKDAVKGVYYAMRWVGEYGTIEDVKMAIRELKEACGEEYKEVCEQTVKETLKILPKIQARLAKEGLKELDNINYGQDEDWDKDEEDDDE